jgi:hypothetical protein
VLRGLRTMTTGHAINFSSIGMLILSGRWWVVVKVFSIFDIRLGLRRWCPFVSLRCVIRGPTLRKPPMWRKAARAWTLVLDPAIQKVARLHTKEVTKPRKACASEHIPLENRLADRSTQPEQLLAPRSCFRGRSIAGLLKNIAPLPGNRYRMNDWVSERTSDIR